MFKRSRELAYFHLFNTKLRLMQFSNSPIRRIQAIYYEFEMWVVGHIYTGHLFNSSVKSAKVGIKIYGTHKLKCAYSN